MTGMQVTTASQVQSIGCIGVRLFRPAHNRALSRSTRGTHFQVMSKGNKRNPLTTHAVRKCTSPKINFAPISVRDRVRKLSQISILANATWWQRQVGGDYQRKAQLRLEPPEPFNFHAPTTGPAWNVDSNTFGSRQVAKAEPGAKR